MESVRKRTRTIKTKEVRTFEINDKEEKEIDKFYESCKYLLQGKSDVNLKYLFTPTGMGNSITVICEALGVEMDVTDTEKF